MDIECLASGNLSALFTVACAVYKHRASNIWDVREEHIHVVHRPYGKQKGLNCVVDCVVMLYVYTMIGSRSSQLFCGGEMQRENASTRVTKSFPLCIAVQVLK